MYAWLMTALASVSLAQEVNATADSCTAYLNVDSAVKGLKVFLDGKPIGVTPLQSMAIATGAHELVVRSPLWPAWNQPDFVTSFVALPNQTYEFQAAFPKKILINSIPNQAKVFLDEKFIGTTPLTITKDEKDHTIRIEKTGFIPDTIALSNVSTRVLFIQMQPDPVWVEKVNREKKHKEKTLKTRRRLMIASLGVATAAGLATMHFRSRGNKAYSDYLSTAVPDEMNRLFEKAQYYDRMAGVSYALFELGFVMSGYFFLSSRP